MIRYVSAFVLAALSATVACNGAALAGPADKTINVGKIEQPATLDPASGFSGNDYAVLYSLYERLIHFDPKTMAPTPGLATEWRWLGEDKLKFEMTLREGVTFHDGTPVNAEAVKAHLDRFKALKKLNDLDVVKSVEVTGPNKVTLNLAYEFSLMPMVLTDRAGMVVSPAAVKKFGDDFGRNPTGAGPFKMDVWTPGEDLKLSYYTGYWNPSKIKLRGMTYKFMSSLTTMVSALISGQVDMAWEIDPANRPVLQRIPTLRVSKDPSTAFNYIALRKDKPPMDNALVRRAMNIALDREVLADAIVGKDNHAGPALMLAPPQSFAHNPELTSTVKYDPAKAKALLAEAGFPNGVTVKVCGSQGVGAGADIMALEQTQWKAAGINLEITIMAGEACLQRVNTTLDFHGWQGGFSGRPDPYLTYSQTFATTGQFNRGKVKHPGVDEKLAAILKTYSEADAKPIYTELNKMWINEAPNILLFYRNIFTVYRANLLGDQPNQTGKPDLVTLYWQ